MMPSKQLLNLTFEVILFVVFALAVFASRDWPSETRYFPTALGLLLVGLTAVTFAQDLRRYIREGKGDGGVAIDVGDEGTVVFLRALREFAWLAGAALGTWLFGFYPAIFLLLLAFFHLRADIGLVKSTISAAFATAVMIGVFYYVLEVPEYTGLFGGILP